MLIRASEEFLSTQAATTSPSAACEMLRIAIPTLLTDATMLAPSALCHAFLGS